MTSPTSSLASRIYRAALRLYPAAFRERFADEMDQVFRQQWRAVRGRGSVVGVAGFVFRTAADLLLTVSRERLAAVRSNLPAMNQTRTPSARLAWSLLGGCLAAALVVGLTTVVSLLIPRTHMSSVRLVLRPGGAPVEPHAIQTELEILQSSAVLGQAAERLRLAERWLSELGGGETRGTPAVVALLRERLFVRQIRNTSLAEIQVYDQDRQLAADIANAVARSFLDLRAESAGAGAVRPMLLDAAEPGLRPVRPNLPLNLFLGTLAGGGLGCVTAGLIWLALRRRARAAPPSVAA